MALWRDTKLQDLARQLTYSPAQRRLEQIAAASVLIDELDATKSYPWEFIVYRLTGYRPKDKDQHAILGKVLRADLSVFVEFISDTLDIPADGQGEPVLTLEQVTAQFGVSSKTIQRWRKLGLLAQRYVFGDGRRRLGFRKSAVEKFAANNVERVSSAAVFRQLSDEERVAIVDAAKKMVAGTPCCLQEITRQLSQQFSRSPETIRYTIRNWDKAHPEDAVFPNQADPIRELDRQIIAACFDRGVSVECLARQYARTRSSIYRAVTQERASRLKRTQIEYVANPLFEHADAEQILLQVLPREAEGLARESLPSAKDKAQSAVDQRLPKDVPAFLAGLFFEPRMPASIEQDLARRMNYLKFKAARGVAQLDPLTARAGAVAEIEDLLAKANAIKNQLVQANLRVAVHVARKHQRPGRDLMELVSDATVWLMRAVERFDFARRVRLSTYATWSIMKNFARDRAEQLTRRDRRTITGQDELLDQLSGREPASPAEALDAAAQQQGLQGVIAQLPARERALVVAHYGLEEEPLSLSQLADRMGISAARIRQLETRALRELRRLLEHRAVNPSRDREGVAAGDCEVV